MKRSWLAAIAIALSLCGCADEKQATAEAMQQAKAYCAAKGKQFVQHHQSKTPTDFPFESLITVGGDCVGPGDPGYVPPAIAKSP
jgi:hypothetical protein